MGQRSKKKIRALPTVMVWTILSPLVLCACLSTMNSINVKMPLPLYWVFGYPLDFLVEYLTTLGVFQRGTLKNIGLAFVLMFVWWGTLGAVLGFIHYRIRRFMWVRRHKRQGICTTCGYNLQGLPEPRCPECGKEFDPATLENDEHTS